MFTLVPVWAHHYDEFWQAIRRRNLWFIHLRYFFILTLASFLIIGQYLLDFQFSEIQVIAIISVTAIILIYNVLLQKLRPYVCQTPGRFNAMHLSLLQIVLDLSSLMVLIYFTGTIDSPLYFFVIFQMVIGSIILPGYIIYFIGVAIITVFSTLTILQYYDLLKTHIIAGLYIEPHVHHFNYVALILVVFATLVLLSTYFANTIAKRLYKREQQLRETLQQLNETEIAKQKYIIGVVHEIKTPIAAVQSYLDLIIQKFLGPVSDSVKDKLIKSKKRTQEAISLINNVLNISKLKILDIKTEENIDITVMLQSLIDRQTAIALTKNININFINKRKTNQLICGDKILLEMALSNIIGNALKYNVKNGKIEIVIDYNKSFLIIEISDSGIGIPNRELEIIFQQFYRASNIKKEKYEGSGLGLGLVKEIIEKHEGKIEAQSPSRLGNKNNPGSTILIKLPLIKKKKLSSGIRAEIIHDGL